MSWYNEFNKKLKNSYLLNIFFMGIIFWNLISLYLWCDTWVKNLCEEIYIDDWYIDTIGFETYFMITLRTNENVNVGLYLNDIAYIDNDYCGLCRCYRNPFSIFANF